MSLRTSTIKRLIAIQTSGWSEGSIEEQRARQEKTARLAKIPARVRFQPVDAGGVPAEWAEAPGAGEGVILYLHGGAYVLGSINTHCELVTRLAETTHTRVLAIDYRLAPEYPYPAALEDATAAYLWLLNLAGMEAGDDQSAVGGVEPSRIFIAGDSAGGGLALATLVALRDAGQPLPAGAVCFSPWTDLALTGASVRSKASADPILAAERLAMYAGYYAGGHTLTSPLISPLYADLQGLPPLLIQAGSDEILLDDAVRLAGKAREAGVDVTLELWDEMFHVFQVLWFLPETKEAVARVAEFVSQRLASAAAVGAA